MPQDSPCSVWDLTVKAEGMTKEDLFAKFATCCKKYAFQLERGEATGYMHYQCRVSLHKKVRLSGALAIFEDWSGKCHVSVTSTEGAKSAFYVMKDQTRVDGPWTDKDYDPPRPKLRTVEKMHACGLFPWQSKLLDLVKEYDDRHIHIVIERGGNTGKSAFCKYVWANKLGQPIPPMQTAEDLVQFVFSMKKTNLYVIDMPRAMKKTKLYGLYSGIETLKNGVLYDKRFHGKYDMMDEPNLIVFTNAPPKMSYLSRDRWKLWTVKENDLVPFEFQDRQVVPIVPIFLSLYKELELTPASSKLLQGARPPEDAPARPPQAVEEEDEDDDEEDD